MAGGCRGHFSGCCEPTSLPCWSLPHHCCGDSYCHHCIYRNDWCNVWHTLQQNPSHNCKSTITIQCSCELCPAVCAQWLLRCITSTQYIIVVLIIFVLEIVGAVLAFVYRDQAIFFVESGLQSTISQYNGTTPTGVAITEAWDFVQRTVSIYLNYTLASCVKIEFFTTARLLWSEQLHWLEDCQFHHTSRFMLYWHSNLYGCGKLHHQSVCHWLLQSSGWPGAGTTSGGGSRGYCIPRGGGVCNKTIHIQA